MGMSLMSFAHPKSGLPRFARNDSKMSDGGTFRAGLL
jgi:hypothetical protein